MKENKKKVKQKFILFVLVLSMVAILFTINISIVSASKSISPTNPARPGPNSKNPAKVNSLGSGLIFYESFDNQSSIINNQGNSSVGSYSFIPGIKGNAIDLTNQFFGMYVNDNYIIYPTNEKFKKGSINFWVKVPRNITYYRSGQYYYNWFDTSKGFFDVGRTGTSNSLGIFSSNYNTINYPNSSTVFTELGKLSGYGQAAYTVNLSDYNWHYISVNWLCNNDSNDYLVIFVDGINNPNIITFPDGCNYSGSDTNDFWIGKNNFYTTSNAYFDEFKIYNYPKNYSDVKADYKSYTGTCAFNSECGQNGFFGNNFCLNNNVYGNYYTYTCNNPATLNSYCSNSSSPGLIETCQYGCTSGHCNAISVKNISTGPVKVIGRKLVVNGKNYTVKSLGYAPTPIGQSPDSGYDVTIHPELRARDFPLIRAMNANTIRTWGKVNQMSFLDDAWNNGNKPIRVIMGYWMGPEKDYTNITVRNAIKADFRNYVTTYKNHPAVLVWAIGNEENYFYGNSNNQKLAAYFSLVNEMAQDAYNIEGASYHPVMAIALEMPGQITTVGNSAGGAGDSNLTYVDMWGINHYPGFSFGNFFSTYETKSSKPMIVTEYGIDAFDNRASTEYEITQAAWELNLWKEINASSAVGGSLMEYSDEYWKAGDPNSHDNGGYVTTSHPDSFSNEEWWGVVRVVKNNSGGIDIMQPRQAYYWLSQAFLDGDTNITIWCHGADANKDGAVNGLDLDIWKANVGLNCSLANSWCSGADMNHDGNVNGMDLDIWKVNAGRTGCSG